ncbi:hypothetical protein VPH35_067805 [Triticum aestivum]
MDGARPAPGGDQLWREADLGYVLILPSMLLRALHNQAWITVSRLQNTRGKRQIVDRGIEFEQVDREGNRDDQIILSAILLLLGAMDKDVHVMGSVTMEA